MTALPDWAGYDAKRDIWTLQIHAQPGAKKSAIVGEHNGRLKLKLAAPAVDNKANQCLIAFVAQIFGVAGRQVGIVRGESARQKTVSVQGAGSHLPDLLERNINTP